MEKRKEKKTSSGPSESMIEDYGDYVTRCICDFQHDDGYMICCDGCGVWQHIECMQVDTKNLPENYLCEQCDPRPIDRKRARHAQIKKREDLSDIDEDDDSPPGRKGLSSSSSSSLKKKRKRGKSTDSKPEAPLTKSTKSKKDILSSSSSSVKKPKKKSVGGGKSQPQGRVGSIQSLLNAASLLESVDESGTETGGASSGRSREHHRSTDIWNANLSPWSDKYDTIDHNRYSEPVRSFISSQLSQLKSEAVVYSQDEYLTWDQRNQPQCDVAEVGRRRKGLVASANIPEDELVIEYMGKITVKHMVANELAPEGSKSLWRHKPCPFVYSYDKISGIDMCIDARKSGTVARFMRRSCSPNSEIRHFFVSNELHFGVYALNSIAEGEEITLPFDFKFDKCEYMMECACGQPWTMCVVARTPRKHSSTKSSSATAEHTSGRGPSRQQSLSHLSSIGDEDSNSSWVSSSGGKKRSRHHQGGSSHGPLSPSSKPSQQTSLEGTSDSDEDTSAAREKEKRRKSLSREERKTEQVWKLVEKMEASLQRKQRQQLLSEGSVESDPPLGSPSQLHPPHLVASAKAAPPTSAGGKEKKGSNVSRKPPLYPGTKMRLSSVSSTDALSPCEFSEALSPPFTPGLATGPDVALTPSHTHSPLISPPPAISSHKPTFIVTPDLHPKYLLADFALPCKKAFLKQWEDEQRKDKNGHTHPYWPIGHTRTLPAYHLTEEQTRRRIRGSLKHRWLKQHREEKAKSPDDTVAMESSGRLKAPPTTGDEHDKENLHSSPPVSHKKLLLLRWEQSSFDKSTLPLSPPPSPHTSHQSHTVTTSDLPEVKRRDSPLFEELSDEEFEDTRKPADSASEEIDPELPKPLPPLIKDTSIETDQQEPSLDKNQSSFVLAKPSKKLDDSSLNLSGMSDVSLSSSPGGDDIRHGPKTPPTRGPDLNVSDISSDFDNDQQPCETSEDAPVNQAEKIGKEEEVALKEVESVVAPPTDKPEGTMSGEDVPGNQAVVVKETESEEAPSQTVAADEEMKFAECAEIGTSEATTETAAVLPAEDVPHLLLAEPLSSQGSAPPSPSAVGTPTKTPGKRKINLSEYRNRARKPAERKTSSEKSSPPTSTSSFLSSSSFLSQSAIASRFLSQSSSFKLSSSAGLLGMSSLSGQVGGAGGSGPQFEPVSPDDNVKTPTGSEEALAGGELSRSLPQQQLFVSLPPATGFPAAQSILGSAEHAAPPAQIIVTPGGTFPPQHPPQSPLVHMVQPGGNVLQNPPLPPPGGQYAMWPPASGAEPTAVDPRKGLIPIPPGHTVVQQQGPPGMYPVHSAPLMQPGIIQHQTHAGDMGGMIPHGGGRGEFHHHGFVGHPPPPGAAGFRPRPPGPGGNYY